MRRGLINWDIRHDGVLGLEIAWEMLFSSARWHKGLWALFQEWGLACWIRRCTCTMYQTCIVLACILRCSHHFYSADIYSYLWISQIISNNHRSPFINSYSASQENWCTVTLWNRIMTAQCKGMGEVGSARCKQALLPPCPSIRVLSFSNCQRSTHSSIRAWQFKC